MLTKSSVLHYWSSRYGINPRVGGRPVFTRNSAAAFTTQEGELDTAVINTPRFDWATLNLPNAQTERRKVLTLEQARTNLVGQSEDMSTWSQTSSTTVTGGQLDPAGGANARLIVDSVGSNARLFTGMTFPSGNGVKAISTHMRKGNVTQAQMLLFDVTAGLTRLAVLVNFDANGVPTPSNNGGAGTIFPVEPLGGGWYRISAAPSGVIGANSHSLYHYPSMGTPGQTYFFGAQTEDANCPSAYMRTVGSVASRAVDGLYWSFPPAPQGMIVYSRHVERGTILNTASQWLWGITGAAASSPEFLVYCPATGLYRTHHDSGVGGPVFSEVVSGTAAIGDTVELIACILSNGQVTIVQSINGAPVTAGPTSAARALAATWNDTRLYLNSGGTAAGSQGMSKFAELKVVKFADVAAVTNQGWMDEMRAFELGPNGDVL